MESFLNRYRNITVLLLVIFAQLVLLAVQVKNARDVPFIRVWTVTAVTPVARVVEAVRSSTVGFVDNYINLHAADAENRRLREEVGRLKIENIFLRDQLNTADRAKALEMFQAKTPSRMLAATIIGTGAGAASDLLLVDAGSLRGVERGMAVVTPDGIVGKVVAAYPTASEVLKVTDPQFAAGVMSQKNGVRGTLKGQGTPTCKLDYVTPDQKVAVGDWLYTSGDDRIFPRGFPAGVVTYVKHAQPYQDILVQPSGLQRGLDDVLIVIQGVHQEIPNTPPVNQQVYLAPPLPVPDQNAEAAAAPPPTAGGTDADKLRAEYQAAGAAQNHTFGEGLPGSKPPDFTKVGMPQSAPAPTPGAAAGGGTAPKPAGAPPATPKGPPAAETAPKRGTNAPAEVRPEGDTPVNGAPATAPKPLTGAPPAQKPVVKTPGANPAAAPKAPPPKQTEPDGARKANQAAGAGPGGQDH